MPSEEKDRIVAKCICKEKKQGTWFCDVHGHIHRPCSCPKCGRENTGGLHCSTIGKVCNLRKGQRFFNTVMKRHPNLRQEDFHQVVFYMPNEEFDECVRK